MDEDTKQMSIMTGAALLAFIVLIATIGSCMAYVERGNMDLQAKCIEARGIWEKPQGGGNLGRCLIVGKAGAQ